MEGYFRAFTSFSEVFLILYIKATESSDITQGRGMGVAIGDYREKRQFA